MAGGNRKAGAAMKIDLLPCCIFLHADEKEPWYVRLAPVETELFPFGLALANRYATKEEAEDFAKDVLKYLKECGYEN
jgi:hypothetical protein